MSWTILQPKMLYEKNPELKAMKTPHQAKRWWQEQRGGRSFLKSYFGAKLALKKKAVMNGYFAHALSGQVL